MSVFGRALAHVDKRRGWSDRLADGSALLARRIGARLANWVSKSRRTDLTGWKAAAGPLLRLVLLGAAAWFAYRLLRALPWLMWAITAGWCWAAFAATRQPKEHAPEEAPAHAPGEVHAAVLDWVRQAIGDRQGVHLRDLLTNAQHHGICEGMELTDFRATLEDRGVPVRRRVRVRGQGVTVGVHRDDLPAPSGPSPESEPQEDQIPRLHVA